MNTSIKCLFVLTMVAASLSCAQDMATSISPDEQPSDVSRRIAALVEQLGDRSYQVRQDASRQLLQMGAVVVPAVRQAMDSSDPEVRHRARIVYTTLIYPSPQQLEQLRKDVQDAFARADYELMAALSETILFADRPADQDDLLWLGHSYQLAGKWRQAVAAYLNIVRLMDKDLEDAAAGRNARQRLDLLVRRCTLAWRIGQMQRVKLNDTKAAVAEWTKALAALDRFGKFENEDHPIFKADIGFVRGAITGALPAPAPPVDEPQSSGATRARLKQISRQTSLSTTDVNQMARLLSLLPPTDPLPELQSLIVLGSDRPEARLIVESATRKQYWGRAEHPIAPRWFFAFAPAPGQEFASLEFACDIKQLEARYGGHFRCHVTTSRGRPATLNLGGISWPRGKPLGRDVVVKQFAIPPGVKVVFIEVSSVKGKFNVHGVHARATLRPVTTDAEPLLPRIPAWIQTEVLPKGGKLTCGDRQLGDERAYHDIKPRKYHVRYEAPEQRNNVFQSDLVTEPARRYGIFANLDSPFTWTQSRVTGFSTSPPPRTSIVPLAGGGYMAVWCGRGSQIMTCFTTNLVDWAEPQAAPFNSLFASIAPATIRTVDGTTWLGFFSNRLQLTKINNTSGHRLWLTSTRDGRQWSRLRPVSVDGEISGWPIGGAHMLQTPDGKCRIFWSNYASEAESFADIRHLRPIDVELGADGAMHLWNPHVIADEQGLLHMVFDSFGMGIHYTTSDNGWTWALPVTLIPRQDNRHTTHPQLLMSKGQAALLYEQNDGAFLTPVRFDDNGARIGDTIKITNHVIPLSGSRMTVTGNGEVLLVAGESTTWLLRANQDDILACTSP